jgi:hypothetical protein
MSIRIEPRQNIGAHYSAVRLMLRNVEWAGYQTIHSTPLHIGERVALFYALMAEPTAVHYLTHRAPLTEARHQAVRRMLANVYGGYPPGHPTLHGCTWLGVVLVCGSYPQLDADEHEEA